MLQNFYSTESIITLAQAPGTLAIISYGDPCQLSGEGVIHCGLPDIEPGPIQEVWRLSEEQVEVGRTGNCHWRRGKSLVVISCIISAEQWQQVEVASHRAYRDLLVTANSLGYRHPIRFWNYLPQINQGSGDAEIYKRFCTGRLLAFNEMSLGEPQFPAASAVGHHHSDTLITLFAATAPGQHHQNPAQVNAYHYPREYGISSPSFARATSVDLAGQRHLFVSGTASIIGHQTVAEDDLGSQIDNTYKNIQRLIAEYGPPAGKFQTIRIYLRHPEHFAEAKAKLAAYFDDTPMIFTQADICRDNLLIEVEGLYSQVEGQSH